VRAHARDVTGPVPLTNAAERSAEEERIAKYTTQMYRAPEMVDLYMRRQLDEKVDVWVRESHNEKRICCSYTQWFCEPFLR
jgi:hypothetical protein